MNNELANSTERRTVSEVYQQLAPELHRLLLNRLRDHAAAEDALHMTFVKFTEHQHAVSPHAFRAWLYRVAINQANLIGRQKKTDRAAIEKVAVEKLNSTNRDGRSRNGQVRYGSSATGPTSTDNLPPPDRQLIHNENQQRIRDCLQQLPEVQKQIVRLKYFEGNTFAEIAEILETPLGTVLSRMRLALKKLHQIYNDPLD